MPVADWSCTAQTSRGSLHRIDRAIAAGDIHPGTRAVVLAAGMNNYGPYGALDGVDILDPRAVRDAYLADMHAAADRVRAVAPGTRIIVPGQLTVADPVTAVYCAVNVVPDRPVGFPLPLLRDVENWNRANQVDAAREIARRARAGELRPEQITEKTFARFLDEPDMPDVDLFLRPSGEKRTSNFLLWQSAYAEMVYQNTLFPDFTKENLYEACLEYAKRDRRFGGVK